MLELSDLAVFGRDHGILRHGRLEEQMSPYAAILLVTCSSALLVLPRRLAPAALLVGACYMTMGQGLEIGSFGFTVVRLLVVVGVVRILVRGDPLPGSVTEIDWLMAAWAVWGLISSAFHRPLVEALVYRLGFVGDACGVYFLMRVFHQTHDDVDRLVRTIALLLLPVAVEMVSEVMTGFNVFSMLGGVPASPQVRLARTRAQGPFAHPILAGTVGAICLPLVLALRKRYPKHAAIGVLSCVAMIGASASSGPVMSAVAGMAALWFWRFRARMRDLRWAAVAAYLVLSVTMRAPPYFLLARIDIAGGSTGWHRARLIQSAFQHLGEWWLGGTDYTRHWMPTGVSWSLAHTDITNEYIKMGVLGGLPLMLLFVYVYAKGFQAVGRVVRSQSETNAWLGNQMWALGSSLFAIAVTGVSVSFFDQSGVFMYFVLGAIASLYSMTSTAHPAPASVDRTIHSPNSAVEEPPW